MFEAFCKFNKSGIICMFELNSKTMVILKLQYIIQNQYFIITMYQMYRIVFDTFFGQFENLPVLCDIKPPLMHSLNSAKQGSQDQLEKVNFREEQNKMCLGHVFFKKNEVCSGSISIATEIYAWIEYYVITYKTIEKKSLVQFM